MHTNPLHRTAARAQAAPGNGAGAQAVTTGPAADRTAAVAKASATTTQVAAALAALTGLWVAISPWFLTLQAPLSRNATANNLIIGLAVAVIGLIVAAGTPRTVAGLQTASLAAGIWLIISPFILDAKFAITAPMYWSNIWAGAIIIVAALTVLGLNRPHAAG